MSRRLLVVTPVALGGGELEERVRGHAGDDAETLVVVPAAKLSRLQWLANDEGDARADADRAAAATDRATGDRTAAVTGDVDPVQAVEDALRTFAADEIVVVTQPDADAEWLEGGATAEALRRFDLPVTHLVASEDEGVPLAASTQAVRPYAEDHEVARGAADHTPASLLGRVGAVVFVAAGAVIAVALILYLLL